jgi:hypothetical protein
MPAEFDSSDFVDHDFQASQKTPYSAASSVAAVASSSNRPLTREELEAKVTATHQKLTELKRAQEELERERAALEEARRRQTEFEVGREEMIQHLTRGVGLLTEAEFSARRDAEQMAKTLADLCESLAKVRAVRDETWTKDDYEIELTRALTTLENARMEWNSARLKWAVLSGPQGQPGAADTRPAPDGALLAGRSLGELCRLGLALTWPLAVVGLLGLGVLLFFLSRH